MDRPDLGEPDVPPLLARAARAQSAIPDGAVTDPRPGWREKVPDIVGVSVASKDGKLRANAWIRVVRDRVVVPAGFAQAARELAELRVLDKQPWDGGLIYIVDAVGGAMPGWLENPEASESALQGGGVRITLRLTQRTLEHSLAGAPGPAPWPTAGGRGGGGVTPPPDMGTATLDIAADYAIRWRYQLGGRVIEGPGAAAAPALPQLSAEQLMTALEGARHRARSPRAMPTLEPRLLGNVPDIAEVPLVGLGSVYVDLRGAAGKSASERLTVLNPGWATSAPGDLVVLLSAVDALPPGIVPADLLPTAKVERGELTAEVPAALASWSAAGARALSPRIERFVAPDAPRGQVRISMRLDSLHWKLEPAR